MGGDLDERGWLPGSFVEPGSAEATEASRLAVAAIGELGYPWTRGPMYYAVTSPYAYPWPGHYPGALPPPMGAPPQPVGPLMAGYPLTHPQFAGPPLAGYPVLVQAPVRVPVPAVGRPVAGYPAVVQGPVVGHVPVAGTHRSHDGFLIELNRYFAGQLGMDPRYTISTNIAWAISQATGLKFPTAKRLFHGGVAGFAAWVLSALGLGLVATVGVGAALWAWLESYDDSTHRR